jgi:hypothetical protein
MLAVSWLDVPDTLRMMDHGLKNELTGTQQVVLMLTGLGRPSAKVIRAEPGVAAMTVMGSALAHGPHSSVLRTTKPLARFVLEDADADFDVLCSVTFMPSSPQEAAAPLPLLRTSLTSSLLHRPWVKPAARGQSAAGISLAERCRAVAELASPVERQQGRFGPAVVFP